MKTDIFSFKRDFLQMRKDIIAKLDAHAAQLEKLVKEQKAQDEIQPKCTAETAERWGIPRCSADNTRDLLNSVIWDIIPAVPLKGSRRSTGGIVVRLRNFIHNNGGFVAIGELVVLSEGQILRYRNTGKKTMALLKDCLSWNGLSLGMTLEPDIMVERINQSVGKFFGDVPEPARQKLFERFSRQRLCCDRIAQLLMFTRVDLAIAYGFDDEIIGIIEKKLASIDRKLRDS